MNMMFSHNRVSIHQVAEDYGRLVPGRNFPQDLILHLDHWYVVSTPEIFVMGRPISRNATHEQLADLLYRFDDSDTWFIWYAQGSMGAVIAAMPYWLPFVGWYRQQYGLKFYPTSRFTHGRFTRYSSHPASGCSTPNSERG